MAGVPRVTIPDNTKTAVKKADLVDPQLNPSYAEMARHYGTTLIPARAGKPKDKAADKNMVLNISRRILAALRNHQFFSLHEINEAIKSELVRFINRPFQKMEGNRFRAFEAIDKPALMALPKTRYEYADWKNAKVAFNYHVEYDGYHYSVPFVHIGKMARIRATVSVIEVFVDGVRIAAHTRNFNPYKRYKTLPEHMPESHKAVTGWSSERFLVWAEKIGPQTKQLIAHILDSREYPVQTYRACMGIMRLASSCSAENMEAASNEALQKRTYTYKYFSMILKQVVGKENVAVTEKIVPNTNIRGAKAYVGGGLNVKNQTIEKLRDMKLKAMAQMLSETDPELLSLPFEERFGLMVEKEWTAKKNSKIKRLLRNATLGQDACIEDIDYQTDRNINKQSVLELANCAFIEKSLNIITTGKTGCGKTYLICAFGSNACRKGYTVKYYRIPELLLEIQDAKAQNKYSRLMQTFKKIRLLILDDLGLKSYTLEESRDILEIAEARYNVGS